jgi:SAM-dependent methyltransferase
MARISGEPAPLPGPQLRQPSTPDADLFVRSVHDYAHRQASGAVTLLEAGCGRPGGDLGAARLRADGLDIRVVGVDHDHPLTRQVSAARADLHSFTLGDLRTVPLPPRSFDIVHCAGLLERIWHVELVLDRFVAALKPGGLLLLRTPDRDCLAGVADRLVGALPGRVRAVAWRQLRPGEPGPYPAVYEEVVCARGICGYAAMRGLVIAQQQAITRRGAGPGLCGRAIGAAAALVARAARGRLTDEHDELLFVIRRPTDRFARVL